MDSRTEAAAWLRQLDEDGYVLVPDVFPAGAVAEMTRALEQALAARGGDAAIRGEEGTVYAARNVLSLWPGSAAVWRRPPLPDLLAAALGPAFGLVRVLFFDKPPQQTWALPWHKDLTIAVRDNGLPSAHFARPTRKAGVPHVEAPRAVLDAMLTARVHLDAATAENGPLKVVPGSHRAGKVLDLDAAPPRAVLAGRGDVLLIRPLVAHCSGKSRPDTTRHRRVLHLEFAASPHLPDGYAWHDFLPGLPAA
jgi:Phytanoyl-CoA dioxygenase (PhyH)